MHINIQNGTSITEEDVIAKCESVYGCKPSELFEKLPISFELL